VSWPGQLVSLSGQRAKVDATTENAPSSSRLVVPPFPPPSHPPPPKLIAHSLGPALRLSSKHGVATLWLLQLSSVDEGAGALQSGAQQTAERRCRQHSAVAVQDVPEGGSAESGRWNAFPLGTTMLPARTNMLRH
jgi:hypothetical protein